MKILCQKCRKEVSNEIEFDPCIIAHVICDKCITRYVKNLLADTPCGKRRRNKIINKN